MGGLEVEEITPVAAPFSGIVVGLVKSVAPAPQCRQAARDRGRRGHGELLTIVCGAPNVAAGRRCRARLIGAKLPGLEIKKAKLRGVESSGMLCSARELGLSDDHAGCWCSTPSARRARRARVLALDDVYLTLKLTPNRGDCLSMFGVARDLARDHRRALQPPASHPCRRRSPMRARRHLRAEACGQYFGRVDPRPRSARAKTPQWMARRLERAGLRAISPLVDITNYVMLERGQPMHAFDNAKLQGASTCAS
jgi:phenylalanyl-tRNA synthetase beta chain